MSPELKAIADGLIVAVKGYVDRVKADLSGRIDALSKQVAEIPAGNDGRDGIDGKDGTPGERGVDGVNGKDGERGEKGEAGSKGERGVDGLNGKDGERGEAGKDGEPGEKGERGEQGLPGKDGVDGKAGEKGADGVDGKSITIEDLSPMLESAVSKWALDFERRAQDVLQRAVERFPVPKDGRDALELEDLNVEHDGDGAVTLKFTRGEVVKEFTLRLPRFKVKGGYREGADYFEGDGVSFGGSFYVSQKDAPAGKPGESEDWWLAAKKGRDGKDAKGIELPVRDSVVRLS